jgi:hypothetical protein
MVTTPHLAPLLLLAVGMAEEMASVAALVALVAAGVAESQPVLVGQEIHQTQAHLKEIMGEDHLTLRQSMAREAVVALVPQALQEPQLLLEMVETAPLPLYLEPR